MQYMIVFTWRLSWCTAWHIPTIEVATPTAPNITCALLGTHDGRPRMLQFDHPSFPQTQVRAPLTSSTSTAPSPPQRKVWQCWSILFFNADYICAVYYVHSSCSLAYCCCFCCCVVAAAAAALFLFTAAVVKSAYRAQSSRRDK